MSLKDHYGLFTHGLRMPAGASVSGRQCQQSTLSLGPVVAGCMTSNNREEDCGKKCTGHEGTIKSFIRGGSLEKTQYKKEQLREQFCYTACQTKPVCLKIDPRVSRKTD